jgi:hypothetical protein
MKNILTDFGTFMKTRDLDLSKKLFASTDKLKKEIGNVEVDSGITVEKDGSNIDEDYSLFKDNLTQLKSQELELKHAEDMRYFIIEYYKNNFKRKPFTDDEINKINRLNKILVNKDYDEFKSKLDQLNINELKLKDANNLYNLINDYDKKRFKDKVFTDDQKKKISKLNHKIFNNTVDIVGEIILFIAGAGLFAGQPLITGPAIAIGIPPWTYMIGRRVGSRFVKMFKKGETPSTPKKGGNP